MEVHKLAQAIIDNGKPFQQHYPQEGGPESGPYVMSYYGYRWGMLSLQLSPNGSVFITSRCRKNHYDNLYYDVFNSGSVGRIQGHWDNPDRKAIQTQLIATRKSFHS